MWLPEWRRPHPPGVWLAAQFAMPVVVAVDVATSSPDPGGELLCVAVARAAADGDETEVDTFHCGRGNSVDAETAAAAVAAIFAGEVVVTFNGGAFSLHRLWEVTRDDRLKEVAREHVDVYAAFVAGHRYASSLTSFTAPTLSAPVRSCAAAERQWQSDDFDTVVATCSARAAAIRGLYNHAVKYRKLSRTAKSGRTSAWAVDPDGEPFQPCAAAVAAPAEVPGWLSTPPPLPDLGWLDDSAP